MASKYKAAGPAASRAGGSRYDALLLVSFGGPEGNDEVIPFLEHVLKGRRVPRERMMEVAEHYHHFGGVSPINAQNRSLIKALERELESRDLALPIYWGNRNWHPFLSDTVRQMTGDGITRALALVTSAYSSYSNCRQYLEDIANARRAAGAGAPAIDKIRPFFHHPGFVETMTVRVQDALACLPNERRVSAHLVYTAHSIPVTMARECAYEAQLREVARLVSERAGAPSWALAFQSRSGPPAQPWLEPDVCDYIRSFHASAGDRDVILIPVGFISDHMEVIYDLDVEARACCDELGVRMIRAETAGIHRRFVQMSAELVEERLSDSPDRPTLGFLDPWPDHCSPDCCPSGRRDLP